MSGYIKLFRQLQGHPLWAFKPADPARAWIDLLLMAAWEPHKISIRGATFVVNRGEIAASIRFLGNRWGWGHSKTASFLHRLQVDNQLEKIQDGTGDGSPSVYRVVNYGIYQGDIESPQDGNPDSSRTLPGRLQDETKNIKKRNEIKPPAVYWSDFILQFPTEDQEVLSSVLAAISSTRKTGRIANSVQNTLADKLSSFPQAAVIAGCKTYLRKECAAEGKDERYLLGIIRRFPNNGHQKTQPIKTAGQLAIEAAAREMTGGNHGI